MRVSEISPFRRRGTVRAELVVSDTGFVPPTTSSHHDRFLINLSHIIVSLIRGIYAPIACQNPKLLRALLCTDAGVKRGWRGLVCGWAGNKESFYAMSGGYLGMQ